METEVEEEEEEEEEDRAFEIKEPFTELSKNPQTTLTDPPSHYI